MMICLDERVKSSCRMTDVVIIEVVMKIKQRKRGIFLLFPFNIQQRNFAVAKQAAILPRLGNNYYGKIFLGFSWRR